ncbi:MAG: DUF1799 domain-containing protein [Burkholderiaceae bacterium]|jgi:folate-dependent tRNA-U54 methylase TrmFO/GidA|nr:DUF1799 domain-containing protein [Burkholderiaceae bacterium]
MALGELLSQDEADARAEEDAAERARALAAFGMRLEDEAPAQELPGFHLLPECVPVFQLWRNVQTQWRVGMMGPTGLDYAGVEAYMRMARTQLRREADTIELLRAMEVATLKVYAERRAEART